MYQSSYYCVYNGLLLCGFTYYCRLLATILSLCWGGYGLLKFYFEQFEQGNQHGNQNAQQRGGARARTPTRTYDLRMYHDGTS